MAEGNMKIKKMELITLVIAIVLASTSIADEEKPKINPDAIPPVISPDDPELQLTAQEQLRLLNAKKADHITKHLKVKGQPAQSIHSRQLERIQKEKFDANPRQTIPLKECIKPNGVIDNDVNDCMNGRIKKTW
ncbi:hypothetical protein O59_002411 [Cellvibrio sp. BR]|nr:hypothetical protein O59_002411 [Cellvibrio sp. BR]